MSRNEFMLALTLYAKDIPVRSLLMAAILMADERTAKTLKKGFPDIWKEVEQRSKASDGYLPDERPG